MVWQYFDFKLQPNEKGIFEEHIICKLCKASYAGKSSSGTGHLNRYCKKCEALYGGGSINLYQSTFQFTLECLSQLGNIIQKELDL